MRVQITAHSKPDRQMVNFASEYGEGVAEWRGENPELHEWYDVELQTNKPRQWGDTTLGIAHDQWTGIRRLSNTSSNTVQGYLESVEPGCAVVRVGTTTADPLLMLDPDGVGPPIGTLVQLTIDDLVLFPYRL